MESISIPPPPEKPRSVAEREKFLEMAMNADDDVVKLATTLKGAGYGVDKIEFTSLAASNGKPAIEIKIYKEK